MEIRIILDDRIVNGAKRIFSRSGLAALTALTLLAGGAALVAQEASEASNVFSPGEVISSSAVNQNFQELHDLIQAQDEEIATKASELTGTGGFQFNLWMSTDQADNVEKTSAVAWDICTVTSMQLDNDYGATFSWSLKPNADGTWTMTAGSIPKGIPMGEGYDFISIQASCFNLN